MCIGFFDSGIGGITVLYEALKILPNENYIYYADTKNVPYGSKTKDKVRHYVFEAVEFIAERGVKALVIACNTATSVTVKELRSMYRFPIIGMEPAVKPAVKRNEDSRKRVLVLATELTLQEEKFKNLVKEVDNNHIVDYLPFPELVDFAENFEFNSDMVLSCVKKKISVFDMNEYGTIVLGCTHFPFFKNILKKNIPEGIDVIDGNAGTVNHLRKRLQDIENVGMGNGQIEFYRSGCKIEYEADIVKYYNLFKILKNIDMEIKLA
ncbi:glutamate racemase [Petroclostridium sp. X23]|uniref:glutamate racemase n=1 Tax=Petroclostridium sp. X23 TaxID=3045146 RepID=UPI0024AE2E0B|nr:glutamate racemase [Petroclostridium sp. X23]WHH58916.1 glutamate racemase [Petroclostridium sp. X23]